MKQRTRNMLSVIVLLVLLIASVHMLGIIVRPTHTDIAFNAIDTFHDLPENTIDVIGYGSSHMWRGFNPVEMYEEYGISAYNYGCNWQHFNTTKLFLEDSFRTQSPKVVVIDTFLVNKIKEDCDITGEIYYTKAISWFPGKQEYLEQCFGNNIERWVSYYMPLYAFHTNWTDVGEKNFSVNSSKVDFFATKGFVDTDKITEITLNNYEEFEQKELDQESLERLDEIMEFCKDNNAKVVFVTIPWQGNYSFGAAMEEYASQHDCAYINFFKLKDEVGIDLTTDFADEGHLNTTGANKITDYLGKFIVENYLVEDARS